MVINSVLSTVYLVSRKIVKTSEPLVIAKKYVHK